jgi:hypothetical protein
MDLVELAGTGVKQLFMTTPLVETERFKEGLARLDAEHMAARALLEAQIARVWQNPERAAGKDLTRVAEQLQAAVWITSACVRVAEGCFELAGSRVVYESSSLHYVMARLDRHVLGRDAKIPHPSLHRGLLAKSSARSRSLSVCELESGVFRNPTSSLLGQCNRQDCLC